MTEGEPSGGAVSYREGDTPVALPGLAVVGVKLLGLYALMWAVPQLMYLPMYLLNPGQSARYMLLGALPPACYAAVGVVLIWNAEWVVSRILRVPDAETPPVMATEHFQAVAFSVVGVLLMSWAVLGLANAVVTYAIAEARRNAGAIVSDVALRDVTYPLVEAAAGLFLFLRGPGLAALWHRMRYGGVRVREVEER